MKPTTKKSVKKSSGRYEAYQGNMVYFNSTAKADRYLQLVEFVSDKLITDLELNPQLPVVVNNVRIADYVADFRYVTLEPNNHRGYVVIESVVGVTTDTYKLKKRLAEVTYGIKIHTIPAKEIEEWKEIIPLNQ